MHQHCLAALSSSLGWLAETGHLEQFKPASWAEWKCRNFSHLTVFKSYQLAMRQKISDILSQISRPVTQTSAQTSDLLDCRRQSFLFLRLFNGKFWLKYLWSSQTFIIMIRMPGCVTPFLDFCHLDLWFAASVLLTRSRYSRLKQENQKQNTHNCFYFVKKFSMNRLS